LVEDLTGGGVDVKPAKPLSGDPSDILGIISGSGLAADISCRKIHNIIVEPDPVLIIPVNGFK
jgi:hypothetical protein